MRIGNNTPGTTLVMVGKGYEDKVQDETSEHYAVIIPMPKDDIDSAVENMIDHMKIIISEISIDKITGKLFLNLLITLSSYSSSLL